MVAGKRRYAVQLFFQRAELDLLVLRQGFDGHGIFHRIRPSGLELTGDRPGHYPFVQINWTAQKSQAGVAVVKSGFAAVSVGGFPPCGLASLTAGRAGKYALAKRVGMDDRIERSAGQGDRRDADAEYPPRRSSTFSTHPTGNSVRTTSESFSGEAISGFPSICSI
jgi:hypothetical protein